MSFMGAGHHKISQTSFILDFKSIMTYKSHSILLCHVIVKDSNYFLHHFN